MVTVLGVPYAEYIGGGVALAIIIFLGWIFLRSKGGRLAEEQEEERETEKLEQDEKSVEHAQIEEKRLCVKMNNYINNTLEILRKGGRGEIYDKVLPVASSASVMLRRLRDEKMSVERALDTFKQLHSALNEFTAQLPNDDSRMVRSITFLRYYQNRYYKDLIKEANLDRDKKARLRKIWKETLDEEKGSGSVQVA